MAKVRSHLVLASARAGAIPITIRASTDTNARLRLVVMAVSLSRCLPGPAGAARARRDPRVFLAEGQAKSGPALGAAPGETSQPAEPAARGRVVAGGWAATRARDRATAVL